MLIGGVSIAVMQATVKLLSSDLHPFIITLYRASLVFIVLLPVLLWKGVDAVRTSSVKMQVARGVVGGVVIPLDAILKQNRAAYSGLATVFSEFMRTDIEGQRKRYSTWVK